MLGEVRNIEYVANALYIQHICKVGRVAHGDII
jgi:hypothetical protein